MPAFHPTAPARLEAKPLTAACNKSCPSDKFNKVSIKKPIKGILEIAPKAFLKTLGCTPFLTAKGSLTTAFVKSSINFLRPLLCLGSIAVSPAV